MKSPRTQCAKLLRELFLRGKPIYTQLEIIAAANVQKIPVKQLNKILSRLAQQGRLLRIKRGLYSPVASVPEHAYPHPFVVGTHLIIPSAISHTSALYFHGLIETLPEVITLITTKNRLKNHCVKVGTFTYLFKQIKLNHFTGVEKVWLDEATSGYLAVPITNKERTLLDCLISPKYCGGLENIKKIIEKSKNKIDFSKLEDYINQYGKKTLKKRWKKMGYCLPER